jgi:hypothetical protein
LSANATKQPTQNVSCQPSIEVVNDEDTLRPCKAVPKKVSHILELADRSEDDDDKDKAPSLVSVEDSEDEDDEDMEAPAD